MADRNQLARERSMVDQSQEQFLKQIIFPLMQAVQILGDRVAWIELPWYKRWYAKIERPISLWFARRRSLKLEASKLAEEKRRQALLKEKASPALTPVVASVDADVNPSEPKPRRRP